jgi:hypothetical protein
MKQTPKSCGCRQCRFGKGTKAGSKEMKRDERAFRHASKIALNKGQEDIIPAPIGNYYD